MIPLVCLDFRSLRSRQPQGTPIPCQNYMSHAQEIRNGFVMNSVRLKLSRAIRWLRLHRPQRLGRLGFGTPQAMEHALDFGHMPTPLAFRFFGVLVPSTRFISSVTNCNGANPSDGGISQGDSVLLLNAIRALVIAHSTAPAILVAALLPSAGMGPIASSHPWVIRGAKEPAFGSGLRFVPVTQSSMSQRSL